MPVVRVRCRIRLQQITQDATQSEAPMSKDTKGIHRAGEMARLRTTRQEAYSSYVRAPVEGLQNALHGRPVPDHQ